MNPKHNKFLVNCETPLDNRLPEPPYRCHNFIINFENLRDKKVKRHFGSYKAVTTRSGLSVIPSAQLVIYAHSKRTVEEVVYLINACSIIIQGSDVLGGGLEIPKIQKINEDFRLDEIAFKEFGFTEPAGFQLAVIMATRALIKGWATLFALYELAYSMRIYSEHPIEFDPFNSPSFFQKLYNFKVSPLYLTPLALAVTLAYHSIEEQGLNPIPKDPYPKEPQKKFVRDTKSGTWGEQSKADLESRLQKAGINPQSPLIWVSRGKKSVIENKMSQGWPIADYLKNVKSRVFRDHKKRLIDAIQDASRIRSDITAHKLSSRTKRKLIRALSPYEVFNVQVVARYLLLKSLKLDKLIK